MGEDLETQPVGDAYIHYFTGDLQKILADYHNARRESSVTDWKSARRALHALRDFCILDEPLPQVGEAEILARDASPAKMLTCEIAQFCRKLQEEWERISPSCREVLRSALAREFHRGRGSNRRPGHVHWNDHLPDWTEVVLAVVAAAAWVVLFAVGYTVHAGPYEDVLKEPQIAQNGIPELVAFAGALFMFIIASIPTNVLLLALIAGVLGTAFRRAKGNPTNGRLLTRAQDYTFSITSSFFVYIGLLAGLMTLTVADALTAETAEKQIQLAGTVSICAFLVGYDRKLLGWMLRRAAQFFTNREGQGQPASPRTPPAASNKRAPALNGSASPPAEAQKSFTNGGHSV